MTKRKGESYHGAMNSPCHIPASFRGLRFYQQPDCLRGFDEISTSGRGIDLAPDQGRFLNIARKEEDCRRLMSAPGVGPITALPLFLLELPSSCD